ncbi:MAG: response regulator [Fidelibacterota bacterium]
MNSKQPKKFYTTGDVARYCEVDVNTVKRWIRHGNLEAFSTPSGHYRITREKFISFLAEQGFTYDPYYFGDKHYAADVLIIDDDPVRLDEIQGLLRRLYNGIDIDSASNGFDGYRKVHPVPPRLIIMDLKSRDTSEIEFLKVVRSKKSFQDLPILVITKNYENGILSELKELQVDKVLQSPVTEEDILQFCNAYLMNLNSVK